MSVLVKIYSLVLAAVTYDFTQVTSVLICNCFWLAAMSTAATAGILTLFLEAPFLVKIFYGAEDVLSLLQCFYEKSYLNLQKAMLGLHPQISCVSTC